MDKLIYALCALTALTCAGLLLRAYARTRARLLLWSGLCFAGLTANNLLVFLDRLVFTEVDLALPRLVLGLASVLVLLVGLVMEGEA
ncbi:DUF5985 family protein [Roseateles sp.]|uniref:DUF5985 family protein n=1 Tax=Roseateles sp. TaxID=1971397 RepID=UPI002E0B5DD7|nr:DUF5985 family protein [Roseateles sp.]